MFCLDRVLQEMAHDYVWREHFCHHLYYMNNLCTVICTFSPQHFIFLALWNRAILYYMPNVLSIVDMLVHIEKTNKKLKQQLFLSTHLIQYDAHL